MRVERQANVQSLQSRAAALRAELASITASQLSEPGATAEAQRISRDYEVLREQYDKLLKDREELRLGGRVQISRYWSVIASSIVDLTSKAEDPLSTGDGFEPIRHRLGIAYEDECFQFEVSWRRDYTQNRDFRQGNTYMLKIAFKNLGR